jgi:flagellar protein FliO/FliZ
VAGSSDTSGSSGHASVGSTSGEIARVIVGLAIVLAVVYGVYWLLKSAARARMGSSDDRISVVATTPIPSNRALHLIRAGDELILVGATEQSITPLRVYTADEVARMDLEARVAAQPGASGAQKRSGLIETIRQFTVR